MPFRLVGYLVAILALGVLGAAYLAFAAALRSEHRGTVDAARRGRC